MFIELEYGSSIVFLIRKIYNFLKNINKTDVEIKNAINLLYNSIDPLQIDNVNYIIDRIISQNNNMMHIITENLINNMNTTNQTIVNNIDPFIDDFIHPTNIINMIGTNINYIINNNNTNINAVNENNNQDDANDNNNPIDTMPLLIPIGYNIYPNLYSFFSNSFNILPFEPINNNITTQDILDTNTIIKKYNELDNNIKEKYKTCTFCLDDYNNDSNIRQLKCEHLFHINCIDPWVLNEDFKCPVCRDTSLDPQLESNIPD